MSSIYPTMDYASTEKELDNLWAKHTSLNFDQRRLADMEAIEKFGKTNQELYYSQKSKFNSQDNSSPEVDTFDSTVTEEVIDDKLNIPLTIKYTADEIEQAKTWCVDNNKYMVIPSSNFEDVETSWKLFTNQVVKYQLQADTKCMELFGATNKQLYELLKAREMVKDIESPSVDEDTPDLVTSNPGIAEAMYYHLNDNSCSYGNILSEFFLSKVSESNAKDTEFNPSILTKDTPFFSPFEMERLGVYHNGNKYSDYPDNTLLSEDVSTSEWFENYKNSFIGIKKFNYEAAWIDKLRSLYSDFNTIKESGDQDRINSRKQSILELGWNPEIDFNVKNRLLASDRIVSILKEMYSPIIDARRAVNALKTLSIQEDKLYKSKNGLVPVFIVLVSGRSAFSKIIKFTDNGPYSHATITFDTSLERLYSYNMNPSIGNGFVVETIKKYNPELRICMYGIFVKPRDLERMKKMIVDYEFNKDKSKYSYKGLLSVMTGFPFEHSDLNMVCSQFVDHILKFTGINISDKSEVITTPNDYYRAAALNSRIYLLYQGPCKDYDKTVIDKYVTATAIDAKYIKESVDISIAPYIQIQEVKSIPIEFDKEGNLLISNMKRLDYEEEYQKCHKLLTAYEEVNNIAGMKYEISKLWFLNSIIEASDDGKKKHEKVRSRILNDFYKYLKYVCQEDENFNFADYYNSTPFSDATIRISQSTLKHGMAILKTLLL